MIVTVFGFRWEIENVLFYGYRVSLEQSFIDCFAAQLLSCYSYHILLRF